MNKKLKANKDTLAIRAKIQGATPLMWVETHEEDRTLTSILGELERMNKAGCLIDDQGQAVKYTCYTWDIADGLRMVTVENGHLAYGKTLNKDVPTGNLIQEVDKRGNVVEDSDGNQKMVPEVAPAPTLDPLDPIDFLAKKFPMGTVVFLKDYHEYFGDNFVRKNVVTRTIRNRLTEFKNQFKNLIVLSSVVRIPSELVKDMRKLAFSLPSREELKEILTDFCGSSPAFKYPTENEAAVIDAALGLTSGEFEEIMAESAVRTGGHMDPAIIRELKAEAVKTEGLLEVITTTETIDTVGGLENLKAWLKRKVRCSTDKARQFGCKISKGVLLVGLPGTGKSLTAKAIAALRQQPLIRFDLGKVYDMYVGNSEAKMRRALAIAEAVAPCVLWIDEVEKEVAGNKGGGQNDGGTTQRVFGSLLTWLAEKTADVFIVATANNVKSIPSELYRDGRINATFWLDLPDSVQREEILRIHLKKNGRDPDALFSKEDIKKIVEITKDRSGATIEVLVQECVEAAYNAEEGARDICLADFIEEIKRRGKTDRSAFKEAYDWKTKNDIPDASINHDVAVAKSNATDAPAQTVTGDRKVAMDLSGAKLSVKPIGGDAPKA